MTRGEVVMITVEEYAGSFIRGMNLIDGVSPFLLIVG